MALASSRDRSYATQVAGVQTEYEPQVSIVARKITQGRYLKDDKAVEVVVGETLARKLRPINR